MPARVRGSTATPAAAPSPTTTTSTGLRLVAMIFACGSEKFPAEGLGGSLHALVFRAIGEFGTRITDEIPAGEVLVAAIVRIAEHSFECEAAHAIEKAAQVGRLVAVDGSEDGILFVGGQAGEGDALGAEREDIQAGEPVEEQRFLGGKIVGQAAVNVIAHATLDGAGAEFVFGDDAVNESVQN